jgi:hypothetical protein
VCVSREDDLIRRWGYLERNPLLPETGEEPPRYYLDGGVLDNKPFSYTTDAIFHRTEEKPVTRKLFYVEPAPEHFDAQRATAPPDVLQAGIGALTVIPGYENIAGDLRAIGDRNTRIQRFQALA